MEISKEPAEVGSLFSSAPKERWSITGSHSKSPSTMKFVSLLLSLFVVTATAAQKPLDRGIHKRKTGGVSFLFGDKNNTEKRSFEGAVALEALPPVALSVAIDAGTPRTCPLCTELSDGFTVPAPKPHSSRFMLPLKERCLSPVAGLSMDRRLFRRANPSVPVPNSNSASVDRVSLAAVLFIFLGLLALGIYSGAFPFLNRLVEWSGYFWGREWFFSSLLALGFTFGFLGLRRTKRGRRRGRILALVSFILGSFLPLSAIVLLLLLLTGNFSIPF